MREHTHTPSVPASRTLADAPLVPFSTDAPFPLGDPGSALRAFDDLPQGVLVLDGEGSLVASNRLARQLLDGVPPGATGPRACCALLGCHTPNGPLEGSCLTELALEAPAASPELRVDLPSESPWEAVWASASRIGDGFDNVIITLRSAQRHDRRRRTEPHWIRGPYLRIETLGHTAVVSRETELGGAWLARKTGKLFKYLLCQRGRPAAAEQIAVALWPDDDLRGLNSVRYYVHALRDVLEPTRSKPGGSSFLVATPEGYTLDSSRVEIDADLFEQHARAGLSAALSDQLAVATKSLEQSLALYGGDFLADEPYGEWAFEERRSLRRLATEASRTLAGISFRTGDLEKTSSLVERLARLSPHDPDVQRLLLAVYLKLGRRSDAWRAYHAFRQRTATTFGEALDFELAGIDPDRELRSLQR